MEKGFIRIKDNIFRTDAVNSISLKLDKVFVRTKNDESIIEYEKATEAKQDFERLFKELKNLLSLKIERND